MKELGVWFLFLSIIAGCLSAPEEDLSAAESTRIHPALQKRVPKTDGDKSGPRVSVPVSIRKLQDRTTYQQTTESPTTTTYANPQIRTHTIVRSQPVYMPFTTESPVEIGGTLSSKSPTDQSLYYTYDEDAGDDKVTADSANAVSVTSSTTTTRATPTRSFWKSKVSDARKKAQRNIFGYNRQVGSSASKTTTTTTPTTTTTTTTTVSPPQEKQKQISVAEIKSSGHIDAAFNKTAKGNTNGINLAEPKVALSKLDLTLAQKLQPLSGSVGRIGEYPFQLQAAAQAPPQFQYGAQGTVPQGIVPQGIVPQGIVPQGTVPQGIVPQGQLQIQLPGNLGLGPRSSKFDASIGNVRYMDNLNAGNQQQILPNNGNRNILNNNNNNNQGSLRAFISAIPPPSANGVSTANAPAPVSGNMQQQQQQLQQNNLVPRTGSFGLGGSGGGLGFRLPGSGGKGTGFTLNLGPVSDPITLILKLLASIPKPLFNLNSRIIFGIELGGNAGLTTGKKWK